MRDWDTKADELSSASLAAGDPTGWFDRLYSAGLAGEVSMPWDRAEPQPLLREWASSVGLDGDGRKAVVVGCGLGADAEYVAGLGFKTVGFDISETAVRVARDRHPGTQVDYRIADVLDLPPAWSHAFDLVVEIFTVQALPDPPRTEAVSAIAGLVAPLGTMLAIAFRRLPGEPPSEGPPFSLTRDDMEGLAVGGLKVVQAEELEGPRWRVEYQWV